MELTHVTRNQNIHLQAVSQRPVIFSDRHGGWIGGTMSVLARPYTAPDVIDGKVVDEKDDLFEAVCKTVSNRIVELQNENYASQQARKLQAWLGDFVVYVFRGG